MNGMRKLMEAVAPLYEQSGTEDIAQQMADDGITYSREREKEIIGQIGEYMLKNGYDKKAVRYYLSYDEDFIPDVLSGLPGGRGPFEDAELVTEDMGDDVDNLNDILNQLEILAQEARSIVQSIDPDAARQLAAYGAFDFGSSDNNYDTTLAGFVEDLESGQYDERD